MAKLKKAISVLVCVSMFFTSSAWAESIFDNILLNSTPMGVYKSGSSGTGKGDTGIYTGGVFLRFGSAYDFPPPLFSVSPAKVAIGCGGLSIKGMFMQLAGLDRLAQMLKNAGTSLAWGVVVGLVYSLPGVMKAFDFLNHWAKTIQQLLANACASGYALGRSIGAATGFDGIVEGLTNRDWNFFGKSSSKAGSDKLDNEEKSTQSFFDKWLDNFDENMVFKGFGSYKNDATTEEREQAWTDLLKGKLIANAYSVNFLMTIFDYVQDSGNRLKLLQHILGVNNMSEITPFKTHKFAITGDNSFKGKIGDIYTVGLPSVLNFADKDKKAVPGSFTFKSKAMRAGIVIAFMRHIGSEAVLRNIDNVEASMESIMLGTGTKENTTNVPATSNYNRQSKNTSMDGSQFVADGTGVPENIAPTMNSFIQVLLYGTGAPVSVDLSKGGRAIVNALGYGIVALKPSQTNTDKDSRTFIVFALDKTVTNKIEFLDSGIKEKGLIAKSQEIIEAMIQGFANGDNSKDTLDVAKYETDFNISWIVPGVHRFIKILQQSSVEDRIDYTHRLASFNAHALLRAIMDAYTSINSFNKQMVPAIYYHNGVVDISRNKDGLHSITTSESATVEANTINREALTKMRQWYQEYIQSQDKAVVDYNELINTLDKLDRKNKQRAIEASPENPLN